MNFKDALNVVYLTRKNDEELKNAFLSFSRMADLIGNSYEDKRKLDLFFCVEKRLNLFYNLQNATNGEVGVMRRRYPQVNELLSKNAFNSLIDAVVTIVRGECVIDKSDDVSEKSAEKTTQTNTSKMADYSVFKATQGEMNDAKGLFAKTEENTDGNTVDNLDKKLPCTGQEREGAMGTAMVVLLAACVVLLTVCGVLNVAWTAYQWIVAVCVTIIFLITCMPLSLIIDSGIFDNVLLGIVVITNMVLFFVFRGLYAIVCYWICAVSVIYGVFAAARAFDDYCYVNGWIDVAGCLLSVAIILLNALL